MRRSAAGRVALVAVAATACCCVALVTAIAGAHQIIGTNRTDRVWLVLLAVVGLIALVLIAFVRDERGRLRLGIAWSVLGVGLGAVALRDSPGAAPGAPLNPGWAVLVAAGVVALVGGVLLAVAPRIRARARRLFVPLVVVGVCAAQVAGYWGAVAWTEGRNVRLSVADSAPLAARSAVLDGRTLWSAQTTGQVVGSAGGLLVTLGNGVRMVDPSTGRPRWTYQRADVTAVLTPVASADGSLVAVVAGRAGAEQDAVDDGRLLVFDAATGAVRLDTALAPGVVGTLSAITGEAAYFAGGPSNTDTVQLSAVNTTGSAAGRLRWVFSPRDGCQINRFSPAQPHTGALAADELALSTSCGGVIMLGQDGRARWTYRTPRSGAEIWPLAGAPAGTVLVSAQAPVGPADPGFGAPTPRGVIALDERTGSVRWQDTDLPTPPYGPASQDVADGSMTSRWAGNTALLAYYLPVSRQVWLLGINPVSRSVWARTLPGMTFALQGAQTIGDYLAVLPDGRILLPTLDSTARTRVTVVDGRTGAAGPVIPIERVTGSGGYRNAPAAVGTPAGVVLDGTGLVWPDGSPNSLLIGLH